MEIFLINVLLKLSLKSVSTNANISGQVNETLNALTQANQTIVSVLSDLPEQPCHQKAFFNHLRAPNLWNKRQHEPTFSLKPFYQSPEQRCFVTTKHYIDLSFRKTMQHRQRNTISNSVLQFNHPILRKAEFKIAGWEQRPPRILSNHNNADAITFMFYMISSFFEKYESLKFQIFSAPLPHPAFLENQYCHVKLNMLSRLQHVQYTTYTHLIDEANIPECDLDQMVSINRHPQGIYLIGFSAENLTPIVPLNAKNDRIYYQRYSSDMPDPQKNQTSPWLILKVQLGLQLRTELNDVFILPWYNSHILDHKYLFMPKVLRPQYTKLIFSCPEGIQFRPNQTEPPHIVTFPMTTQQKSLANRNWTNYLRSTCDRDSLQNTIFPYGSLEILLLRTSPPETNSEICQTLPDATNPRKSYATLQNKIQRLARQTEPIFFTWSNPFIHIKNLFSNDYAKPKSIKKLLCRL